MLKTTSNIKSFTRRMDAIAKRIPKALDKGLSRWAVLAHKDAMSNLSGPGGTGIFEEHNLGGYPVPVRTGHLRRSEGYVLPGSSKHGITARHGQAYLVNTAVYAKKIHEAKTGKFSPRPFIDDAINTSRRAGMDGISKALREALLA